MGVSITEGTRTITSPPNFNGPYGLLIDGNIIQTEDHFDVYNPATNSVLASAPPQGTREHMERAIGAAKRAFPAWAALTADEREAIIVEFFEPSRPTKKSSLPCSHWSKASHDTTRRRSKSTLPTPGSPTQPSRGWRTRYWWRTMRSA